MNPVLIGALLLNLAYHNSPQAQCTDQVGPSNFMGLWGKSNETDDHGVVTLSKDGVYAITDKLLYVRKFGFDGTAPHSQFIVGTSEYPADNGTTCLYDGEADPNYSFPKFDPDTTEIVVHLPTSPNWEEMTYFAVWCRQDKANFGWIKLPVELSDFKQPAHMDLGEFQEPDAEHGTKGKVKAISSQVFELSMFDFDPKACKSCFFMAGTTDKPDDTGGDTLPDEGLEDPPKAISKAYKAQTVMIKLQQDKSYCMYKWFGIYNTEAKKALGHVMLKEGNIPPEVGQNGKGWGPTSTTLGYSSGSEEPETESEETPEETEPTTERTAPRTTKARSETTTQLPFPTASAVKMESAYGIILAANTAIQYFYH